MSIELDHLFLCTDVGAPEADRLVALGFREGTPNVHPGQGTANRRFFFRSAMLELLWVHDAEEAQSDVTRPTLLYDRWLRRKTGACPFGFIFRPRGDRLPHAPFPGWEYRPNWLDGPEVVHVGDGGIDEPMWIYMSFLKPRHDDEFTPHPNGVRDITRVSFTSPGPVCSSAATMIFGTAVLRHRIEDEHRIDIEFDRAAGSRTFDLRPDLPLILGGIGNSG